MLLCEFRQRDRLSPCNGRQIVKHFVGKRNSPGGVIRVAIEYKWTILVLFALRNGKRRFAELRREIRGVTEKMLIQTLRNLERDGIVARKVYPTVPPRVEYSISELIDFS